MLRSSALAFSCPLPSRGPAGDSAFTPEARDRPSFCSRARFRPQDYIDTIRNDYRKGWVSSDRQRQQIAVAMYFIDKLALRAGHEKDEDEADTVGCCSLRVRTCPDLSCPALPCPVLFPLAVALTVASTLASALCLTLRCLSASPPGPGGEHRLPRVPPDQVRFPGQGLDPVREHRQGRAQGKAKRFWRPPAACPCHCWPRVALAAHSGRPAATEFERNTFFPLCRIKSQYKRTKPIDDITSCRPCFDHVSNNQPYIDQSNRHL